MKKFVKIILFGFFIWLIVFAVSILIFPFRQTQRALFESIMPVVLTLCTVIFAILYLRNLNAGFMKEGILIGVAWLVINLAIDLPLFMLESPMQMSLADYMMDIGLTYLIIPTVTIGFGYLLQKKIE